MSQAKFHGAPVVLGEKTYIVPALTVRQVKTFRPKLSIIPQLARREPTDEEVDSLMSIALAALQRNYPDLTADQLEEMTDMNSLPLLMAAITGQTKLEAPKSGEAAGVQSTGTT